MRPGVRMGPSPPSSSLHRTQVCLAGCGQTACWIAGMRSRERGSRENRRFSCLEKVLEDFFHGLLVRLLQFLSVSEGARRIGRGCPRPVAGRSLRPSGPPLSRRWLRSAIHGSAGHLRRLSGHGHPLPSPPYFVTKQARGGRNASSSRHHRNRVFQEPGQLSGTRAARCQR